MGNKREKGGKTMKLSWKARKEIYAPDMKQSEIAEAISEDSFKVTREDLNRVMNGKAANTPRNNRIRVLLDRFFSEKEKGVR